jgi:hypothetical protein
VLRIGLLASSPLLRFAHTSVLRCVAMGPYPPAEGIPSLLVLESVPERGTIQILALLTTTAMTGTAF